MPENKFIHIRSLEKYHPGYKDRELKWAKIHFNMVQGDPDCEMIDNEIDFARLIKFIILELQAKKPIPLNESYLVKKGFNLKIRSISLTLNMLQNFIIIDTDEKKLCVLDKDKEEDKEEDKEVSGVTNHFTNLIPQKLFLIAGFDEAWSEWVLFRKEIKHSLVGTTARRQLKFLLNQPDPIACLNQSIQNQWQGLFPIKTNGGNYGKPKGSIDINKYQEERSTIPK